MEVKKKTGLVKSMFILLAVVMTGCTSAPKIYLDHDLPFDKSSWKGFDAVYEYYEFHVYPFFDNGNYRFYTNYCTKLKLHILTKEGAKYGTIILPKYGNELVTLKVRLFNETGRELEVDHSIIKKKYHETRKVVVPNVQEGFTIELVLKTFVKEPRTTFECWFQEKIPVAKKRFTIKSGLAFKYNYTTFGQVKTLHDYEGLGKRVCIWEMDNIYPYTDIFDYKINYDDAPRVLTVLSSYKTHYKAPDWKKLSKSFKFYYLNESIFQYKEKISQTTQRIVANLKSDREKAEKILDYIQHNISYIYTGRDTINLERVFANKQGNIYEMTLILNEMLKSAGLKTDILVTRGHDHGGFYEKFPSWMFLQIPLVQVELDSKKELLFPLWANAQVGEYPSNYFNLKGLSLNQRKIVNLPDPVSKTQFLETHTTLVPGKMEEKLHCNAYFKKYYSPHIRNECFGKSKLEIKTIVQKMMDRYSKGSIVKEVEFDWTDKGQATGYITYANNDYFLKRKMNTHCSFSPFYRTFFTDYVPSRTLNYPNDLKRVYKEVLTITKEPGYKIRIDMKSREIENELFHSKIYRKDLKDEIQLIRETTINKTELTPEKMKDIYPDIQALNGVKGASMVVKKTEVKKRVLQ